MTIVATPGDLLDDGLALGRRRPAQAWQDHHADTRGSSTTLSSGLAMVQALTLRPSTSSGTAKGMNATMPTAASNMNAPCTPGRPSALSTIIGRNGAQGVMPIRMSPIA